MHYVPGHEVAAHITQGVRDLALSTSIPWAVVRETQESGSYSCRVGDIIATKMVGYFDCSPVAMQEVIMNGGALDQTPVTILEEYDRNNHIIIVRLKYATLQKQTCACLFRYAGHDKETNMRYVVHQSVDHDAIFNIQTEEDCVLLNFGPTGCVVIPVPDEPNKCKCIHVSQILDLEQQTSKEFVEAFLASAGSLGRMWEDFKRGAAEKRPVTPVSLEAAVEDLRRGFYANFYELDAAKNWKAVSHLWYDLFIKEEGTEHFSIALRSRSFTPEVSCRAIAKRIFNAMCNMNKWHFTVLENVVVKEIDDSACILKLVAKSLDKGPNTETLYLVYCRENIDGVCDVAWRTIVLDEFPITPGRVAVQILPSGCIISPNGHGSTIQWLLRTPTFPTAAFSLVVRRTAAFANSIICFMMMNPELSTRQYVTTSSEEHLIGLPQLIEQIQSSIAALPTKVRKRKMITPSLVSVDNVVGKIVAGKQPARPFLFLVSDGAGKLHRFVRRWWDSALRSTFDLLPPELLEYIFSFLDIATVLCKIPCICSRFKDFLESNTLWKQLFQRHWGTVEGRLALRYCGDDDSTSFFSTNFQHWREVFWEREHIELAWREPELRSHGFRVSSGHSRDIRAVVIMPRCHRIVTGSLDKLMRVWDVHSGSCVDTMNSSAGVVSLWVADSAQVKVGYKSGVVRLVDLSRMEARHEIRLADTMQGCTFFNDKIATWDEDVELWDEATQQRLFAFTGHAASITDTTFFSPSLLLSSSQDKTIQLWDITSGSKVASLTGHTHSVNGIAVLSERNFASVSNDSTMRVWDSRRHDIPLCVIQSTTGKLKCVKYTATGNKICAGGTSGIEVWNGTTFSAIMSEKTVKVESIAMDEERLVYTGVGGVIRFYDFAPRK